MTRRIILGTCLAGIIAGSAGAALASPQAVDVTKHDVCVAIAQNDNYNAADYYCIDVNQP